jgi:hypothetical protein
MYLAQGHVYDKTVSTVMHAQHNLSWLPFLLRHVCSLASGDVGLGLDLPHPHGLLASWCALCLSVRRRACCRRWSSDASSACGSGATSARTRSWNDTLKLRACASRGASGASAPMSNPLSAYRSAGPASASSDCTLDTHALRRPHSGTSLWYPLPLLRTQEVNRTRRKQNN